MSRIRSFRAIAARCAAALAFSAAARAVASCAWRSRSVCCSRFISASVRACASARARSVCAALEAEAARKAKTAKAALKDRLPIYIRRYRHAEVLQHGWRDVHDIDAARVDLAARDERARGLLVVVRPVVA